MDHEIEIKYRKNHYCSHWHRMYLLKFHTSCKDKYMSWERQKSDALCKCHVCVLDTKSIILNLLLNQIISFKASCQCCIHDSMLYVVHVIPILLQKEKFLLLVCVVLLWQYACASEFIFKLCEYWNFITSHFTNK